MNNNDNLKLEAISGIDEDIIEKNTVKRFLLLTKLKAAAARRRRIVLGVTSMAASLVLLIGVILGLLRFFLASPIAKTVPVYEGMSVSGELPSVNENVSFKGNGSVAPIKHSSGFGDVNTGERYRAKVGDYVYITVHVNNPDAFEIVSFTLNGEKYVNYMFEDSSDLENLILKVNVGDEVGIKEYTIDAIKYIDGTEIKDVIIKGNRTVGIEVYEQTEFTAAFYVNGAKYFETFYNGSVDDIFMPDVPPKTGYTSEWRSESSGEGDIIFKAEYKPITYTATFKVNGTVISTQSFTVESVGLSEPSVPAMQCYYGKWAPYEIIASDITVEALYTRLHADVLQIVPSDPTCEKEGNIAYWKCRGCNKCYSDVNLTDVISDINNTVIGKVSCSYVNGICKWCGELMASKGLEYLLSDDGTYYTVIGNGTFNSSKLVIPKEFNGKPIRDVAARAFEKATNIRTVIIQDNIESVGSRAFNNGVIEEVTVGANVKVLEETAFMNCPNIRKITVSADNKYYRVSEDCLIRIKDNRIIRAFGDAKIPTDPNIASVIGYGALCDMRLEKLFIPKNIKYASETAFAFCYVSNPIEVEEGSTAFKSEGNCLISLESGALLRGCNDSVIPDGVTKIEWYAFSGCDQLESVTIPSTVNSIGKMAFYGCRSLKAAILPSSVTEIGDAAFEGCVSLTELCVPSSVTSLASNAFKGCTSIEKLTVSADYLSYIDVARLTELSIIDGTLLSDQINSHNNLKTVRLEKVSTVKSCFNNCAELQSVFFGDGVSIIEYSFDSCYKLKDIAIGKNLSNLKESFRNCGSIETITLSEENSSFSFVSGCLIYNLTKSIVKATQSFTIPEDENIVTSIGIYAFSSFRNITSLHIPANIHGVGWNAFAFASNIEQITVDEANKWLYVENNCLITKSEKKLVLGCKNSVIPNDVTEIEQSAFKGCSGLKEIVIPDSVTLIGGSAFRKCEGLTKVVIGNGVTKINSAFSACTSLKEVVIGTGVELIYVNAFKDSNSIESIIFADTENWYAYGGESIDVTDPLANPALLAPETYYIYKKNT